MDHSQHHHMPEDHNHMNHGQNAIADPHQNHGSMMMHHAMSFHFGVTETILFDFWKTDNGIEMFFSCVAVIAICLLHQTFIFIRNLKASQYSQVDVGSTDTKKRLHPQVLRFAAMDCGIYFVQLLIAYVLMLVFMTFNVYLCLAVLIGEIAGRFNFIAFFPEIELKSSSCM